MREEEVKSKPDLIPLILDKCKYHETMRQLIARNLAGSTWECSDLNRVLV